MANGWKSLYPTEGSVGDAIKAPIPSGAIPDINAIYAGLLGDDTLTPTQREQLRTAAGQLGLAPPSGVGTTGGGNTGYPGLSAADQAIISGYQNPDNGMPAGSDAAKAAGGGDGSGPLSWIQNRAGDIALIVLALIVIAVALFATVQRQELIMKTVKSGITG